VVKYRKKPAVIDATQWFKNGDHPEDCSVPLQPRKGDSVLLYTEGKIVRYYRRPDIPGASVCKKCGYIMHDHGWIDTGENGHDVCPGDWIITGIRDERYPCKPDIFEATYDLA